MILASGAWGKVPLAKNHRPTNDGNLPRVPSFRAVHSGSGAVLATQSTVVTVTAS